MVIAPSGLIVGGSEDDIVTTRIETFFGGGGGGSMSLLGIFLKYSGSTSNDCLFSVNVGNTLSMNP